MIAIREKHTKQSLLIFLISFFFFLSLQVKADQGYVPGKKLDSIPTADSSSLFMFSDGGGRFNVPDELLRNPQIKIEKNGLHIAKSLSATLWYPDMTAADFPSVIERADQESESQWTGKAVRFRVRIISIFFSDPSWDDLSPEKYPQMYGLDPRPRRIIINAYCLGHRNENCLESEIRRVNLQFNGIDQFKNSHWEEEKRDSNSTGNDSEGGLRLYVEKKNSPYELFMRCDEPECQAFVFNKKRSLQYRLLFPSSEAKHTDEVIRSINHMIDVWAIK